MDCSLPGSSIHGIFLTQGLNPGLPCCRQTLHRLSHSIFTSWQTQTYTNVKLGSQCINTHVCAYSVTELCPYGLQPARLLCPQDFLGKNSRMGCHFPFPGDLPDAKLELISPALVGGFFTTWPPGEDP